MTQSLTANAARQIRQRVTSQGGGQTRRLSQGLSPQSGLSLSQSPYSTGASPIAQGNINAFASPLDSIGSTISGWLGSGGVVPAPNYNLPAPDSIDTSGIGVQSGSSVTVSPGKRYIAGVSVSPLLPDDMVKNQITMLPGFTAPVVYPAASSPYSVPSGAPAGANWIVSATYSGATTTTVPLPPGVLWVSEALPDAYPSPPSSGGTPPVTNAQQNAASAAASGLILGMQPTTALLVGGALIVAVVLITSKTAGHPHPRSSNPSRARRRIRR